MNRHGSQTNLIMLILFFIFFLWKIEVEQCQTLQMKEKIISAFSDKVPKEWGVTVSDVKTRLNTGQEVIALGKWKSNFQAMPPSFDSRLFVLFEWVRTAT